MSGNNAEEPTGTELVYRGAKFRRPADGLELERGELYTPDSEAEAERLADGPFFEFASGGADVTAGETTREQPTSAAPSGSAANPATPAAADGEGTDMVAEADAAQSESEASEQPE